jgi:pyruvate formate-lyase/glycerol dehydratase family glycyl radical enzyme
MNERIQRLRQASLDAEPAVSAERAQLITRFYREGSAAHESVPVQRARAFEYLMTRKKIWIGDDELIVGERGPAPKATPTYPEVCLHSLEDLDLMDARPKVPFAVDEETRRIYAEEVIPFWKGRTVRDAIFARMTPEWKAAYGAGIFTEFQEQRSPGHTANGGKIYRKGFADLKNEMQTAGEALDFFADPEALDKQEELRAMAITADALIRFARRHSEKLKEMAATERDDGRRAELDELSRICTRVPEQAPRTFHEALQYYWFVHVGVITELNPWDAFNPGRLDQHLFPFYERDLAEGRLTRERARELLQAFWIKFNNHPAPPKTGVTLKESNTYVDFALINVGGVTPDNRDGVNEVSFLLLEVIEEMRLLQPSSMVQISRKTPDRFLHRALDIVKTGFGQPSIFNTDAIVQELVRQGKSVVDARKGGASGCVEAGSFGRECYILTGYFNLPKILELALNDGIDPRTGDRLGPPTGSAAELTTFEKVYEAFERQLRHFADIKIRGNNVIERINATRMPVPFLSLLIDDCIASGKDYNGGGARYNTSYIQGVGIGSVTDSLSAIQHHIFGKEASLTLQGLLAALADDFAGHNDLRRKLLDATPKYGNDDERADHLAVRVMESYYAAVNGRPNNKGGVHRIILLPTTCHVYFGSVTGALPDGRRATVPLSEGISPVQGADRNGPTAVIKSAARLDHIRTGGTLLNQKFIPQVLADKAGINGVGHLVRAYFNLDGHHIQFNVVDAAQLLEAQRHPDDYRDLIVRVAGYSDYFVDLTPELQDEIIRRTQHEGL